MWLPHAASLTYPDGTSQFAVCQALLGSHQLAQFTNAEIADFVHADEYRGADRQGVVTNLADDRWRHFQSSRQGGIVFQLQLVDDCIEDAIRVVGRQRGNLFERHDRKSVLVVLGQKETKCLFCNNSG